LAIVGWYWLAAELAVDEQLRLATVNANARNKSLLIWLLLQIAWIDVLVDSGGGSEKISRIL
jgi:hypothetical protein